MLKNKLKKFVPEGGLSEIWYRPDTMDLHIIERMLVFRDEYRFPKLSPQHVFDIGANIGASTILLNQIYPEATIHCFEPEPENFEILQMNTEHIRSKVVLNKVALSNYNGHAYLMSSGNPKNHGEYSLNVISDKPAYEKQNVPVIGAKYYMTKVGIPEVIKIDCEGSEYNILLDVPDITKVMWIAGELHNVKDFELLAHLNNNGFEIETVRAFGAGNWTFHAASRAKFFVKNG